MTTTNDYRINWKKLSITQEGEGTIVHPLIALAITPIMGLAFLMFLPLIGFYLCVHALVTKAMHVFNVNTLPVATGAAYLTGNEPQGSTTSEDLDELHKEIQSRRGN
jgi:hypothetical protein